MRLRDIRPATKLVKVSDDEGFVVRGLSAEDIYRLVDAHMDVLAEAYLAIKNSAGKSGAERDKVIVEFVEKAPRVAAHIIAAAEGDESEDAIRVAQSLPFGPMVDALMTIGELTLVSTGGGVGKLARLVAGRLEDGLAAAGSQAT